MTVGDAHLALASMIGDPIVVTGSPIPDGVRFSKALRDLYLWRAMQSHIVETMAKVQGMPHYKVSDVLALTYPTMTLSETTLLGAAPNMPFEVSTARAGYHIYSVLASKLNGTSPTLAFAYHDQNSAASLIVGSYGLRHDPMYLISRGTNGVFKISSDIHPIDLGSLSNAYDSVIVKYLPVPINPSGQAYTATLDFELGLVTEVLKMASVMARFDDQDMFTQPGQA